MSHKVTIYTKLPDNTGHCPFCILAMDYLRTQSIPYEERQLNIYERQKLYDQLGLEGVHRTVPQAVLYDEDGEPTRIGGFKELTVSGIKSLFSQAESETAAQ
jgi:glutaredoxin